MATSGVSTWTPDVAEIVAESFERCGVDPSTLTARHMVSARRSFNYLFVDWANDGVHLWAVDTETQTVTQGDAFYDCPVGTVAILQMTVARSGTETPVFPMARDEYLAIPNKTEQGLPNRFYFDKEGTTITGSAVGTCAYALWDVPENSTDVLTYHRLRQLQTITASAETPDVPYRWQEALAAGLSARLAEKYAPDREDKLLRKAAAALKLAKAEDRERTATETRVKYRLTRRR